MASPNKAIMRIIETIKIDGKEYELNDTHFPTIDPKNPYKDAESMREI